MSDRPVDGFDEVAGQVGDGEADGAGLDAVDDALADDAPTGRDPAGVADARGLAAEDEPARTEVTPTGDERVDAALDRLPELDRLPTSEHVAVYEEVHRSLQDALGAAAGGGGAGSGGPRPAVPGPPRR